VLNNRHETFGTFAVNGLAPGQPVERSPETKSGLTRA
jgi:hypothetical protein